MALTAVDWGTTNCRAYALDAQGRVTAKTSSALGILSVPKGAFPDVLAAMQRDMGVEGPVLIAGMAGSNRGWFEAPYVAAPASAAAIAAAAVPVPGARGVWIAPGVRMAPPHRADVMRGEETQILGAGVEDGLLCLPGTHTKWARVAAGAISAFSTTMAGEVFSLLRKHSILSGSLPVEASAQPDTDGFLAGLGAAKQGRFLSAAFGVRPMSLLEGRGLAWCEGYLSGLVIGTDVREGGVEPGAAVTVIGADGLARLYADGLRAAGAIPRIVDGAEAFVHGAWRIAQKLDWEI
jgi:2-dehydro-3-deoxygalactonokinase